MANRKHTLIHLHGTTDLENASLLNVGEIAVKNAEAGSAKLFITNGDGSKVVSFMDAGAVNAIKEDLQGQITELVSGDNSVESQVEAALESAKGYTDGRLGTGITGTVEAHVSGLLGTGITTANNVTKAIADAKQAASEGANTAEQNAKDYADDLVNDAEGKSRFDAAGSAAQALTDAKAYTESRLGLDSGTTVASAINDAKEAAIEVADDAQEYAEGVNNALTTHTGNGDIHVTAQQKIDWQKATDAINAFVKDADMTEKAVDTLKEIQEYMNSDGEAATELIDRVDKLEKADEDFAAQIGDVTEGKTVVGMIADAQTAATSAANNYTDGKIGTLTKDTVAAEIAAAQEAAQKHSDDLFGTGITTANTVTAQLAKVASDAATDATNKANTAEQNAKTYTNGKIGTLTKDTVAAEIAAAQEAAEAYADGLAGNYDAAGSAADALADAKTYTESRLGLATGTTVASAISTAKSEVVGSSEDTKDSNTVVGAKKYAESLNSAMDTRVQTIENTCVKSGEITGVGETVSGTVANNKITFDLSAIVIDCGTY